MIRSRIVQYIDSKGISKYKFYKDNSISNGFLDKEGSVRSDICEKISYQYIDLNLVWLITGKGEMLLENTNPPTNPLNGGEVDKFDISPEAELNRSEFKDAKDDVTWYRKLVSMQQKTIDESLLLQKGMFAELLENKKRMEKMMIVIKQYQKKYPQDEIG